MSEFVWLCKGDKLPAVAVAQMLLNRNGASLSVDGNFGKNTKSAVQQFQSQKLLGSDGVIGRQTWPRLVAHDQLQIIDCIDVFDPDLFTSEANDIRGSGGNPILIGGMCNGITQAIREIRTAARGAFLVRFHGHGISGVAGLQMAMVTLKITPPSGTTLPLVRYCRNYEVLLDAVAVFSSCIVKQLQVEQEQIFYGWLQPPRASPPLLLYDCNMLVH